MPKDIRPPISEPMQREVRQRFGFCCAICGEMPTEIHHIVEYSIRKQHEVDNLILLCDRHHKEVSSGRLSRTQVLSAWAYPYCSSGRPARYSFLHSEQKQVHIASSKFIVQEGGTVFLFDLDDQNWLSFRLLRGIPLFSMSLYGSSSQEHVEIVDNVFSFPPIGLFDIRLKGKKLTVNLQKRKKLLEIRFDQGAMFIEKLKACGDEGAVRIENNQMSIFGQYEKLEVNATIRNNFVFVPTNHTLTYLGRSNNPFQCMVRLPKESRLQRKEAWKWLFRRERKAI
ncbi:MAG: HNH endonuclease signature motif containing protein [Pseudomonadota bacterium]